MAASNAGTPILETAALINSNLPPSTKCGRTCSMNEGGWRQIAPKLPGLIVWLLCSEALQLSWPTTLAPITFSTCSNVVLE